MTKLTNERIAERRGNIEMAQFRRGITIGRAKLGRQSAVRELATAWLRTTRLAPLVGKARHLPSCVRFSGYAGTEGDCSCGAA